MSTTIFSMLFSQQCFKLMYYKEICCEICFLPVDRGQQWPKFMSENEPLPAPQRDSARDNTGETILTSPRDPTPARPACTRTQAQARQTGERSYANIGQLDCCAYLISVYLYNTGPHSLKSIKLLGNHRDRYACETQMMVRL